MKYFLLYILSLLQWQAMSAQIAKMKTAAGHTIELSKGMLMVRQNASGINQTWELRAVQGDGLMLQRKSASYLHAYQEGAVLGVSLLTARQYKAKKAGGIILATMGGMLFSGGLSLFVLENRHQRSIKFEDEGSHPYGKIYGAFMMGLGGVIALPSLLPWLKVRKARLRPLPGDGGSFYVYD